MNIKNNTIIITGGASGIGLALTKKLVEHGNKIIVIGRDIKKLSEVSAISKNIFVEQCDLSDVSQFESLLVKIENDHPDVNVLINNAAVQLNYYLTEAGSSPSVIDQEIDINFKVPVKLTTHLLPILENKSQAAVVNITSGLAFTPKENASVYCSTKAAIHSFSMSLRYQLEGTSIKVFELIPPLVNTDMTKGRGSDKVEPEFVADGFIEAFKNDKYEISLGKIKILRFILRVYPKLANKILRKS